MKQKKSKDVTLELIYNELLLVKKDIAAIKSCPSIKHELDNL